MKNLRDLVLSKLDYNPLTGVFTWVDSPRFGWCGKAAGTLHKGYLRVRINNKGYQLHRLAYLIQYNYLPDYVDHINGDRSDNRIINLRSCTNSENCTNRSMTKFNKSGYKGVSKVTKCNSWQATINKKYLGAFKCKHNAARIWNTAARMYQGYQFCYTNKIEKCECDECRI